MIQDVIIQQLNITKLGEQHYFQINVPRSAEAIVGVEVGAFINQSFNAPNNTPSNRFFIRRNRVIGEVRLQMPNQANFFYSSEIVSEDKNIGTDDIPSFRSTNNGRISYRRSLNNPPPPPPIILNNPLKSFQHTHGYRKEVDEILTCNERIIYGCYKDIIAKSTQVDLNYTIQVYIWYQEED